MVTVAPSHILKVEYNKFHVGFGNELAPKDVRAAPSVIYNGDPKAFYTLMMVDPDAPSRKHPTAKQWQHWVVGNIPGADISKGETLAEYVGSGPPKNTGLHRYVFLLYKQPAKVEFKEEHKSKTNGNREKFSVEDFAKQYKLGNPVAGNYFEAQFDDSVPELHKQIGSKN